MIAELDLAIVSRLRGTDVVPPAALTVTQENVLDATQTQPSVPYQFPVPVTMQIPDEWFAQAYLPAVNAWRLDLRYNPDLFRVGQFSRPVQRDDGSGTDSTVIETKPHALPFKATYEIGLRTRYQLQLVELIEAIQQRMPPMGFGSFLTVGLADGDIIVPFQQLRYIDLTDQSQRGERNFEARFTYEMDIWLDSGTWQQEKTVHTIMLDVFFPAPGQIPTGPTPQEKWLLDRTIEIPPP